MGEKMSLQEAIEHAQHYMQLGGGRIVHIKREAWDTIIAHLTQPAQAVDVGAEWRPFYAAVIQSIAVLARARTIDDGPREAILRETVMGEVTRIRAALDRFGKTMTTAALSGKQP